MYIPKVKVMFLMVTLLVMVFSIGYAGGSSEAESGPITLRLAHARKTDHVQHQAALFFKETVERESNGEIIIEIFPDSSLGSPPEYMEQVIAGIIDLGLASGGDLQPFIPAFSAEMTPFLFDSYEHAWRAYDGELGDLFEKEAEDAGVKLIAHWEYGFRQISNSVHPVETPEDVAALTMRVPPEFQLEKMYESLGATITTIAYPELFMALTQGVADGQCNPLATIWYDGLWEAQSHVSLTSHVYSAHKLTMSLERWEELSPEHQEILTRVGREAGQLNRQLNYDDEAQLVRNLKDSGVEVVEDVNLGPFRAQMEPVYTAIADRTGQDFFEELLRLAESSR
jgi:TRAP-type transport system periplasmic protein